MKEGKARDIKEGSPEGNQIESLCSALTGKSMVGRPDHPTSAPGPRETREVPLGWELGGRGMSRRPVAGVERWSWWIHGEGWNQQ